MNESQLLFKVKHKDREAQELLYDSYKNLWFSICLRYTTNESDALDVLQNALVNIYTKIDQFDISKGNFKSWSSKIVVNDNLMFLRKKSSSFYTYDIDQGYDLYDEEETALERLSAEELTKLIQNLPEGYRTIFNLYVIEGYSHKEISEHLGVSESTSRSLVSRGRKMIIEAFSLEIELEKNRIQNQKVTNPRLRII